MAISEFERARIKHHLRYPLVHSVSGFMAGDPTTIEALFPIDGSITNLTLEGEQIVRDQLSVCDKLEEGLASMGCHLSAQRVGNITMRDDELEQRKELYAFHCKRLADSLGADLNPAGSSSNRSINTCRSM